MFIRSWPDSPAALVYALHQRTTHLLEPVAAALLRQLLPGEQQVHDLAEALLPEYLQHVGDDELIDELFQVLSALQVAGLVVVRPC